MRIEYYSTVEQLETYNKTSKASVCITQEANEGRFEDTTDVLAFLSGYCKDEPVLINEIYDTIRELQRKGLIKR